MIKYNQELKESIINLLSFRLRSRIEVERRYLSKGYNAKEINSVLNHLESKGYINDEKFAKMYASYLIKSKLLGKRLVLYKFKIHQIEMDTLVPIIDELYKKYTPSSLIKIIIKRKFPELSYDAESKKRIHSYLKRKGFSWKDYGFIFE